MVIGSESVVAAGREEGALEPLAPAAPPAAPPVPPEPAVPLAPAPAMAPAAGEPAAPEPAGFGAELPAALAGGVDVLPACGVEVAIEPAAALVVPALADRVGLVIDELPAAGVSPAAGGVALPLLQAARAKIVANPRHFGVYARQSVTVDTPVLS